MSDRLLNLFPRPPTSGSFVVAIFCGRGVKAAITWDARGYFARDFSRRAMADAPDDPATEAPDDSLSDSAPETDDLGSLESGSWK